MIEMLRAILEIATPQTQSTAYGAFPSPAEDHQHPVLHVGKQIVTQPIATFFYEVLGDAMESEGIFDGDTVVIDRSLNCRHGHLVIATIDGEFYVRKIERRAGKFYLCGASVSSHAVELSENCEVIGRITWILRKV